MRLLLRLSPNTRPVPYDHLAMLTGVLHKWLGPNREHDRLSLYSFGWLRGAKAVSGALQFAAGSEWAVSFLDPELGERLRAGVRANPDAIGGMRVYELAEQITPRFGAANRFLVDGAVLTRRRRDDGGREHLTFRDPESDVSLTGTLRRRLAAGGLPTDVEVAFDRDFERARTKLVTIKGTQYRTSECPVVVRGAPEAVRAAWLVGVGELTGMGLGALK